MEKPNTKQRPAKEIIAELKAENAKLKETIQLIQAEIDERVETAIKARIIEKEKYITKVETECDDKIANKDLIIVALRRELAAANKKAATKQQLGFFSRIFKKNRQ